MFHPFELAFCGLSGSGKTTLLTGVLRHFRDAGYDPGYFKHGCHRFDIDREGKDSYLARQAGAATVMISDPGKEAIISVSDTLSRSGALLHCDLLFIEGLKELPIPKMLLVDAQEEILGHLENGTVRNVVALVHQGDDSRLGRFGLPAFHRDDLAAITEFIGSRFRAQASAVPLYGLVLAGGMSERMGTDKARLNYGGKDQLDATAALLSGRCEQIFVSCRREQAGAYAESGLPLVTDDYLGMGPLGGLLSAQRRHPEAAWLVAACDFPFLDAWTIGGLVGMRDPLRFATAFRLPGSELPEPLCTIYEPKSRQPLLYSHAGGCDSLSAFLRHSRIAVAEPANPAALRNVNDKEAMHAAMHELNPDTGRC